MMLLSSLRNGGRRRASLLLLLLLLAAVLLGVIPVSASPPAGSKCPRRIECAQERRHFCRPGSSHCGPCLSLLEENEEGLCVERKKHHQRGKITFNPDLDEEIDFLHSVIEKQEVTEIKPHKQQSKHPAAVTSQKDAAKGKTDATKHRQENQDRLSDETERATTAAVHPTVSALPDTPTPQPRATRVGDRAGPLVVPTSKKDGIVVILMSLFVVVGTLAMILATVCFIKLQKKSRLAQKVDYPAFGKGGAPAATASGNGVTMGDKTLAQSAQMFHYQHQKQQMLSLGSHKPEQKVLDGEATSEEEEVGGDFTVYECPGLAPTGEMEVKNPLFDDSALHYQGNHK